MVTAENKDAIKLNTMVNPSCFEQLSRHTAQQGKRDKYNAGGRCTANDRIDHNTASLNGRIVEIHLFLCTETSVQYVDGVIYHHTYAQEREKSM